MNEMTPHRRIVTGHTPQGKAIFERDEEIVGYLAPSKDAQLTVLWSTDAFPNDNTDPRDGKDLPTSLVNAGGSVLRIVDMLPHSRSPMHRTISLDYGIVTRGEIWLELDDGAEVLMRTGDVVVQRGTIHAWVNKSEEPSSIVFVLLASEPLSLGNADLSATHLPGVR